MKRCSQCEARKTLSEFSKNVSSSDGFRSVCQECDRISQGKYRARTKKEKAVYDRMRWQRDREKLLARNKVWAEQNRERRNEINRNRYTRKINKLGIVPTDIKELLRQEQGGLCYYCSKKLEKDHLEHKVPLVRGGMHDRLNLCLSCPSCNLCKGIKTEEEFRGGDGLSFANVE